MSRNQGKTSSQSNPRSADQKAVEADDQEVDRNLAIDAAVDPVIDPTVPLVEGRDFTNENGFFVLTANFLLRRGYCCNSGCRNCPYGKAPR